MFMLVSAEKSGSLFMQKCKALILIIHKKLPDSASEQIRGSSSF
jgi:hypothetical protein